MGTEPGDAMSETKDQVHRDLVANLDDEGDSASVLVLESVDDEVMVIRVDAR